MPRVTQAERRATRGRRLYRAEEPTRRALAEAQRGTMALKDFLRTVTLPGLPAGAWGVASDRVGKPEVKPDGTVEIPYRVDFAAPVEAVDVAVPLPPGTTREEAQALVDAFRADFEAADQEPTDEGRRRYPPDGRYDADLENGDRGLPCTCTDACPMACRGYLGGCGCRACGAAYADAQE